jgi:TetR/AcrR family transcriptional regulator, transcriptional repressor for nem operon
MLANREILYSGTHSGKVVMSRNRLFSEDETLDRAMNVFWDKGYGGTSLKDIEVATGLRPGSLYHSFSSKHGLFLKVLERYIDSVVESRIATACRIESPEDGIRWFFHSAIDYSLQDGRACILTNTAIEIGLANPEIAAKVRRGFELTQDGFDSLAARIGVLSAEDAHLLATHLLTSFQGLLVLTRVQTDRKILESFAAVALSVLPDKKAGYGNR